MPSPIRISPSEPTTDASHFFFKDYTAQQVLNLSSAECSFISVSASCTNSQSEQSLYLLIHPSKGAKLFRPQSPQDSASIDLPIYEKILDWDVEKESEWVFQGEMGIFLAHNRCRSVFVTLHGTKLRAWSFAQGKMHEISVREGNGGATICDSWIYPKTRAFTFKAKWNESGDYFTICDGGKYAVFQLNDSSVECIKSGKKSMTDLAVSPKGDALAMMKDSRVTMWSGKQFSTKVWDSPYELGTKHTSFQCDFICDDALLIDVENNEESCRELVFLGLTANYDLQTIQNYMAYAVNAVDHRKICSFFLSQWNALIVFKEDEELWVFTRQQGEWIECMLEESLLSLPFDAVAQHITIDQSSKQKLEAPTKQLTPAGPTFFIVITQNDGSRGVVCASFGNTEAKSSYLESDFNPFIPAERVTVAASPATSEGAFNLGQSYDASKSKAEVLCNLNNRVAKAGFAQEAAELSNANSGVNSQFSFGQGQPKTTSNQQKTRSSKRAPAPSPILKRPARHDHHSNMQHRDVRAERIRKAQRNISKSVTTAVSHRLKPKSYSHEFSELEQSIENMKANLRELQRRARAALPSSPSSSLHLSQIRSTVDRTTTQQTQLKKEIAQIEKNYRDTLNVIRWKMIPSLNKSETPNKVSQELNEVHQKIESKYRELEGIVEGTQLHRSSLHERTSAIRILNDTIQTQRTHLQNQRTSLLKIGRAIDQGQFIQQAPVVESRTGYNPKPIAHSSAFSPRKRGSATSLSTRSLGSANSIQQRNQSLKKLLAHRPPVTSMVRSARMPYEKSVSTTDDDIESIPPRLLTKIEQIIQNRVEEEVERSMQSLSQLYEVNMLSREEDYNENEEYGEEDEEEDYDSEYDGEQTEDDDETNEFVASDDYDSVKKSTTPPSPRSAPSSRTRSPVQEKSNQFSFGDAFAGALPSTTIDKKPTHEISMLASLEKEKKEESKPNDLGGAFSFGRPEKSSASNVFNFGGAKSSTDNLSGDGAFSFSTSESVTASEKKDEKEKEPSSQPDSNPFTSKRRVKKSNTDKEETPTTKPSAFSFETLEEEKKDASSTPKTSTFSFGAFSLDEKKDTSEEAPSSSTFNFGDASETEGKEEDLLQSSPQQKEKSDSPVFSFGQKEGSTRQSTSEKTQHSPTNSPGPSANKVITKGTSQNEGSEGPPNKSGSAFSFGSSEEDENTDAGVKDVNSSTFSFPSKETKRDEPTSSFLSQTGPALDSAFGDMKASSQQSQQSSNFSWDNAAAGFTQSSDTTTKEDAPKQESSNFSIGGAFGTGFGSQQPSSNTDNSSTWANTATTNSFSSWQSSSQPSQPAMNFNVQASDDSTSNWKENFSSSGGAPGGSVSNFFNIQPSDSQSSSNATFGGGSSGFGSSSFGSAPAGGNDSSTGGFGTSSFGAAPTSGDFGSSSFGQASDSSSGGFGTSSFGAAPSGGGFGQSTFGQSSEGFGASSFGSQPQQQGTIATDGGFGSFSSTGASGFASSASGSKGWI